MSKNKSKIPPVSVSSPAVSAEVKHVPVWIRRFVWFLCAAAGLLALWAMVLTAESTAETNRMVMQGWGEFGAVIVRNKINALWHAAGMTAVVAAFMALITMFAPGHKHVRKIKAIAVWILVALVAGDALWLARHYVKTMPLEALQENDVVRILKADQPDRRVAMAAQDGFYNFWLTYLFPYHDIRTVNVAQMPRMPDDYKQFLGALGNNPLRLWRLMAAGYILAPAQFWVHINNDPELKEHFELVYAFNVAQGPGGVGVTVMPATPETPGQHAVIRLKAPAPRYTLIAGWRAVEDREVLRLLAADDYPLFQETLVAPEWAADLPEPGGQGMTGLVQRVEYRPGFMRLSVSVPETSILRVSEKYDRGWKARVNDESVPVRRVDYLFQGVLLEPGLHEVVLRYAPGWWTLAVQVLTMLVCIVAAWRFLRSPSSE